MRALVIQHAEHETAGLLGAALAERGAQIDLRLVFAGHPVPATADEHDALIVLGGPMAAWDPLPFLDEEARLLASAVRAGRPTLGVCLGAQLLARGLGARVYRGPALELGLAPIALTSDGRADPLLAPFDGAEALHWHSDTFDLPVGATHLASSARYPNQAFRLGARAYGVQFHPECDRALRRTWARHGADELRGAGVAPESLEGSAALDERGRALARAFVALVNSSAR
jgi:GMP synthase (glutamine-hydrolysing)